MSRNRPRARMAVLLLSAACLISRPAWAVDPNRTLTQYVHRIWQVPQGLPQATIYTILQDSDGYLWLGTQSGLVRFDGVRFATIDDRALAGAWVQSLVEDRHGNLWVGTRDHGLVRLQHGVVVPFAAARPLSDNVRTLLVDRRDALWVAAGQGATVARIADGKVTTFTVGSDAVTAACEAEDGTIWMGGASSDLSVWNGAGFARYRLTSVPPSASIQAMLRASDGARWIGTNRGLIRIKDGRERLMTTSDGLVDDSVLALTESREGGVWVGTKNGFSRLRPGDVESFGSQDGLSQSTVFALFEDREGSFWVGTKHGLNQFLDGRTIPYTAKEGLPSNDTGPLLQDDRGSVWVGTLDAGLGRYDGHRFTVLAARNGLPSNTVRALARDGAGEVWVGTNAGLARLRDGRVEATYAAGQGLPGGVVRSLFVDPAGVLWIGTSAGVVTRRGGAFVRPPLAGLPASARVTAFAADAAGRVVAAVEGDGVYVLVGDRWTPIDTGARPLHDVDALYLDSQGALWMGTVGSGLWLVDKDTRVSYSVRDGLFDDEIYGIVADAGGRLWMACSKGIFSVNRADLMKFAAGAIRHFASTPYSPTDALRTIECRSGVQPAVWAMLDGRLWFSTIRGVIVIDPNHLDRHLPAPPVIVEDVTVNGQRERPADVRRLPPGARNVAFVYTALSFIAPTRITFKYILDGFDRDWTDAGTRREAFYTNLPPGPFRFHVQACNVDGTCAEARPAIAFTIAPRLYQHAWFLPVLLAVAGGVTWLVYRLRVRRLRAHFAIVLAERNRIARELHDTLIQGFAGITMQLQALLGRLPASGERADLEEVIREAAWCLREARQSLAGLRSVYGGSGLAAAVARTARQLAEGRDIRLKLRIDPHVPDLPAATAYDVLRIAQEAISNAVRHSDAVTIEVGLAATPRGVQLSVGDDGVGFEGDDRQFMELGHYGLVGMRERAREIGGDLSVETGRGQGTKVTLVVPAGDRRTAEEPAAVERQQDTG